MGQSNGAFSMERIEYARRQALDAYQRANECMDTRHRDEWLKTAALWEAIGRQYETLLKVDQEAMGYGTGARDDTGRRQPEAGIDSK